MNKWASEKNLGASWRRADLKHHYHAMSHDLIINMCGLGFENEEEITCEADRMKALWLTKGHPCARNKPPTHISRAHVCGFCFPIFYCALSASGTAERQTFISPPSFYLAHYRVKIHRHRSPLLLSAELHRLSDPAHGRGPRSHVRGQQRLYPLAGSA